jgi:hypothetical protein
MPLQRLNMGRMSGLAKVVVVPLAMLRFPVAGLARVTTPTVVPRPFLHHVSLGE